MVGSQDYLWNGPDPQRYEEGCQSKLEPVEPLPDPWEQPMNLQEMAQSRISTVLGFVSEAITV